MTQAKLGTASSVRISALHTAINVRTSPDEKNEKARRPAAVINEIAAAPVSGLLGVLGFEERQLPPPPHDEGGHERGLPSSSMINAAASGGRMRRVLRNSITAA